MEGDFEELIKNYQDEEMDISTFGLLQRMLNTEEKPKESPEGCSDRDKNERPDYLKCLENFVGTTSAFEEIDTLSLDSDSNLENCQRLVLDENTTQEKSIEAQSYLKQMTELHGEEDSVEFSEVLTKLEELKMTREILKVSKVGRELNEMRRRTNFAPIKQRMRELIKIWKAMISEESCQTATAEASGEKKEQLV